MSSLKKIAETKRRLFAGVVLLTGVLGFATNAFADDPAIDLDLEQKVWSSAPKDLPQLESQVVLLIQKQPNSSFGHYLLSYFMLRQFAENPTDTHIVKQASDLAEQAVDIDPKSEFGYIAMANVLEFIGHPKKALQSIEQGKNQAVSSWRTHFTYARILSSQVQISVAISEFSKALTDRKSNQQIIMPFFVNALSSALEGKQLVSELNKWHEKFPHPSLLHAKATALIELGDHLAAKRVFELLVKNDPNDRDALINYAILLTNKLALYHDSVKILENTLNRAERGEFHLDDYAKAIVYAHLGASYLSLNSEKKAISSFVRSSVLLPHDASILEFMTQRYRDQRKHRQFVKVIDELNRQIPGVAIYYALLGETLSQELKNHKQAIDAFDKAILLEPKRSEWYNSMGLTYYRMEKMDYALALFHKATQIDPNDATAKYNEACALSLLGRSDDAIKALKVALDLDPRLRQTAKKDGDFRNIRSHGEFLRLTDTEIQEFIQVGH